MCYNEIVNIAMRGVIVRNRISELRQKNNLTQKELAEKLDINYSVLSRIETNDRPIKGDELLKIADFFALLLIIYSVAHLTRNFLMAQNLKFQN